MKKLTQAVQTELHTKQTVLLREIHKWTADQRLHMPHISWARDHNDFSFTLIGGCKFPPQTIPSYSLPSAGPQKASLSHVHSNNLTDIEHAEYINLWLPSDVPAAIRHLVVPAEGLIAELELLVATLHDCLVAIRKWQRAYLVVRVNFRGNYKAGKSVANTGRDKITDLGKKIEASFLQYQAAWHRAKSLSPDGDWQKIYRVLERKDIRGPNPADDASDAAFARQRRKKADGTSIGHGTYEQSWIWLSALNGKDEPEEAVQVQWAKMAANADRWSEELIIVVEEMRRVLAYFEWYANWWREQVDRRGTRLEGLRASLNAHALRQEADYRERIRRFAAVWLPIIVAADLPAPWIGQYKSLVPSEAWSISARKTTKTSECIST